MTSQLILDRSTAEPANAYSVRLRDPSGTWAIRRQRDGQMVVAPTDAISPEAEGIYTYSLVGLAADAYEVSYEIVEREGANPHHLSILFSIDAEVAPTGVRLLDIERDLAKRVGPYFEATVATSGLNGLGAAYLPDLQSSLDLSGLNDLFLLRRCRAADGTLLGPVAEDDRIRLVAGYDPATGRVQPDRLWSAAPIVGELIEFHSLHPDRVLRAAVRGGLAHAFFGDRILLTFATGGSEQSLASALPWCKRPGLIQSLEAIFPAPTAGSTGVPTRTVGRPILVDGSLILQLPVYWWPVTLYVNVLRPADSLVNGSTSLVGPTADDDTVQVDLTYAVAAAHRAAWEQAPHLLVPLAQSGLFPPQAVVARHFQFLSKIRNPPRAGRLSFWPPFGTLGVRPWLRP